MVLNKLEDIIEICLENTIENCDYRIMSIYLNYYFYQSHIRKIIVKKEGNCCCADKTNFIIKSYIEYSKTNKYPIFDVENFWVPSIGTNRTWMEFLESLTKLLDGDNKDYLLKYQELVRE